MKKLKPWLVLGLVFAAGVVVGVGGTRVAVKRIIEQATAQPEWVAGRIERGLVRELRITPDQRPKLHEIVMRSHGELQELRREVRPRLGQILKRSEGDIRALLNERQQQRFDEMLKKRAVLPQPARFDAVLPK
jgi:Spy/CpxP family protein refolding chaperone